MFKKENAKPAQDKAEVVSAAVKLPEQKSEIKATQPLAEVKQETKAAVKPQGLSQREAVYNAVMGCFQKNNVKFTGGKANDLLTPEIRKQITDSVCADFKASKVSLRDTPNNKSKLGDEKQLRVYVTGLINNWLRRDKRLNGTLT